MGVVLRDLAAGDAAQVRALVLAGLAEHWGELDPTVNPDLDDLATAYPGGRTLVAEEEGRIVATGTVVLRAGGVAEIVRMSVATDRRRGGLGRLVLDELVATGARWGVARVVLETTSSWDDVVAFYLRAGFRITHETTGAYGADTWFERRLDGGSDGGGDGGSDGGGDSGRDGRGDGGGGDARGG